MTLNTTVNFDTAAIPSPKLIPLQRKYLVHFLKCLLIRYGISGRLVPFTQVVMYVGMVLYENLPSQFECWQQLKIMQSATPIDFLYSSQLREKS